MSTAGQQLPKAGGSTVSADASGEANEGIANAVGSAAGAAGSNTASVQRGGQTNCQNKEKDESKKCDDNFRFLLAYPCRVTLNRRGSNYRVWRTLMPAWLQCDPEIWDVIQKQLVKPDNMTGDNKKLDQKYERANKKARILLFSSINHNLINSMFGGVETDIPAAQIWSRLEQEFGKGDPRTQLAAIKNMLAFKFSGKKTAAENVKRFEALRIALFEAGVEVFDEKFLIHLLLKALPERFAPLRWNWGTSSENNQNIHSLCSMITSLSDDFDAPRRSYQDVRSCYNCGVRGHLMSACRRPRRTEDY